MRDRALTQPAQGKRAERNAELICREKIINLALQAKSGAGTGTALSQQLLQACFTHGNDRKLGRDKERGGQNQHRDCHQPKERRLKHGSSVNGCYVRIVFWKSERRVR